MISSHSDYLIRCVDWSSKTTQGIPEDLENVRHLFNANVGSESFQHIPRTTPVDIDEARQVWVIKNQAVSHWIAVTRNTQTTVGSALVIKGGITNDDQVFELKVIIAPDHHGKGLGRELCRNTLDSAFESIDEVQIKTACGNAAMKGVINSLKRGFEITHCEATESTDRYLVRPSA